MKTCPFCKAPMEDNAKFCTNCGQKQGEEPMAQAPYTPSAEQELMQQGAGMTYAQQPNPQSAGMPYAQQPNQQGAEMTYAQQPNQQSAGMPYAQQPNQQSAGMPYAQQPNQQGAGMPYAQQPNQQGAGMTYTQQQPNQQGMSRSAMQQGSMSQNGMPYGAMPQGAVPQGSVPQGGMPQGSVPQQRMAQTPKKKSVLPFIIIGAVALIAVITVVVLVATGILGGGKGSDDDQNLGEWKAVSLETNGQILDAKEYMDGEMVIVLNKGGKASIIFGSDKASATWSLSGDKFTIKGGGLDETGTLKDGVLKLPNFGGMGIIWIFTKDGIPVSRNSDHQTGADQTAGVSDGKPDVSSGVYGADSDAGSGYNDTDVASVSFQYFAGDYCFSSGAGGWATEVTINADGSFTGLHFDYDMGDMDEEKYPNGTLYRCNFSGTFSKLKKKDDYTYTCTLESITQEKETGTEEIDREEGRRVIYSYPYGFDDGKEFEFYLPGKRPRDCDEVFLSWTSLRYNDPYPDTLLVKSFNNLSHMYAFQEMIDYEAEVEPNYPKSLPLESHLLSGEYANQNIDRTLAIEAGGFGASVGDCIGALFWTIPEADGDRTEIEYLALSDNGFDVQRLTYDGDYYTIYKMIVTDNTSDAIVIHLYDERGRDCGEYVMTKPFFVE